MGSLSHTLQADHPIPGARRPPRRRLLGGLALVVVLVLVLVVVLLTRGSADEPRLTVTDGAATAGFPLRGDRAGDTAAIRAAGDAWLASDAREDVHDRVLDHDEDVEMRALWAGRLRDTRAETTVVMLAEGRNAALLERSKPSGAFHLRGVQEIRSADDPGVVAFSSVVLVDTKADAAFMPTIARPHRVASLDGLWATSAPNAGFGLPDGALVLRNGMRGRSRADRTAPVAVLESDTASTWLLDAALLAKLVPRAQGGFAPPAYQRLIAATALGKDDKHLQRDAVFDPPKLALVQDRPLPVLGPTMVLTAAARTDRDRVLVGVGGSSVAGKEDEAESLALGDGRRDGNSAGAGDERPAFAAAIVDRGTPEQPSRGLSVFVAGSSRIDSIEVLTGRSRMTRRGPVAVVRLPAATDLRAGEAPRPRGDVAVLGRTRAGTLVVPNGFGRR